MSKSWRLRRKIRLSDGTIAVSEVRRMSSDEELNEIGVLKRREIEARLLHPSWMPLAISLDDMRFSKWSGMLLPELHDGRAGN